MSESVITVARGDSLDATKKPCVFCERAEGTEVFGITAGKKYDGILLKHFVVCEEHLDKINALVSGDYDIDQIELEKYRKQSRSLRFRG